MKEAGLVGTTVTDQHVLRRWTMCLRRIRTNTFFGRTLVFSPYTPCLQYIVILMPCSSPPPFHLSKYRHPKWFFLQFFKGVWLNNKHLAWRSAVCLVVDRLSSSQDWRSIKSTTTEPIQENCSALITKKIAYQQSCLVITTTLFIIEGIQYYWFLLMESFSPPKITHNVSII